MVSKTRSTAAAPTAPEEDTLRIEYRPLSEVQKWPRNPKRHADADIRASYGRFGYIEPMVRDERTKALAAGHGRLDNLVAEKAAGNPPPKYVKLRADGEWLVPIVCGASFSSDAELEAYIVASNRLTEKGGWDEEMQIALLRDAAAAAGGLVGTGYSQADVDALIRAASGEDSKPDAGVLAQRFLLPPFSVLDARQGYWQERKRAWLALGIESEFGRSDNLLKMSATVLAAQGGNGTSVFDPVICELACRWFGKPGAVMLDPFAGGSVRGVVAAALGLRYIGIDLRAEQVAANAEQWKKIGPALAAARASIVVEKHDTADPAGKPRAGVGSIQPAQAPAIVEGSQEPPAAVGTSGEPEWARGYRVEDLKAIAACFAAADRGFALGGFARVKEADVAAWAAAGELECLASPGLGPIAVAHVQRPKKPAAIRDFAGTQIDCVEPGDVFVRRMACRKGWADQLVTLLLRLAPGGDQGLVAELWQESEALRAVAKGAGLHYVGTKIRASSELVGVWSRAALRCTTELRDLATLEMLRCPRMVEQATALARAIRREGLEFADHYSSYNAKHAWSAVALRGYAPPQGPQPAGDFIEKPAEMSKKWKTENAEKLGWDLRDSALRARLPEAEPLIAAIPGVKHRVRIMRLAPGGGELLRHADITDPDAGTRPGRALPQLMRIHIPLATNPDVIFEMWRAEGQAVQAHMNTGEAWYLDTRKPHRARNGGDTDRLHLVMDVESCPELLGLLPPQQHGALPPTNELKLRARDTEKWTPRKASPAATSSPPTSSEVARNGSAESAPAVPALQSELFAPRWHCGDSAELLRSPGSLDGSARALAWEEADLLFSCPPYADLEVYSDDARDLSRMGAADFDAAYRRIIELACGRLRHDRFAVWVIGDVRDRKGLYRDLVSQTIAAFRGAGLALYNEAILVTSVGSLAMRAAKIFTAGRKLGKAHQQVLVFVKGDPAKAAAWLGPVEVVLPVPGSEEEVEELSGPTPAREEGRKRA